MKCELYIMKQKKKTPWCLNVMETWTMKCQNECQIEIQNGRG